MTTPTAPRLPDPTPARDARGPVVPLRRLALAVQVALVGWLPLAFVAFAIGLDQRSLAHRIQDDPLSVTLAEVRASDHRADVLNRIFLGCLVVTGILFIAWFRRAYRNLDGLHAPRRFGPGWSVGAWLVPFLNFVRPKQMADDIWAANDLARTAGTRSVGTPPQKSGLVKAWWVAWVASTLVALFIPRGDPRTLDDLLRANALYLVRDGLLAVAAVLALVVVRRITADQAAVAAAHLEHAEPRRDGEPR